MAKRKETAEYFPFYVKDGRTLFLLQKQFGLAGVGFFTNLMRTLCGTPGHVLDLSDETDRLYTAAKLGAEEKEALAMLELMSKTGKIDVHLWAKKVIYSQDLVDSLSELYDRRASKPETVESLYERFNTEIPEHNEDILHTSCQQNATKGGDIFRRGEEQMSPESPPPLDDISEAWKSGIAREAGVEPETVRPVILDELGIPEERAVKAIAYYFDHWRRYWFAVKKGDMKREESSRLADFNPRLFAKNIQAILVDMGAGTGSEAKAEKARIRAAEIEAARNQGRPEGGPVDPGGLAEAIKKLAASKNFAKGGSGGRGNLS